jgi:hypothetical protein
MALLSVRGLRLRGLQDLQQQQQLQQWQQQQEEEGVLWRQGT